MQDTIAIICISIFALNAIISIDSNNIHGASGWFCACMWTLIAYNQH